MSFLRNSFSISKTKPRKYVSRSPLKLPAEELARKFGPYYQIIDACIGTHKMVYDTTQAEWIPDGTIYGTTVGSREMEKLDKTKRELEENNNILHVKIDTLLEMFAEVTAEYDLRRAA